MKTLFFLLLCGTLAAQTPTQMLVSGGLMAVSGYAEGVRETLNYHYVDFKRVHPDANDQFWNPDQSWTNKYRNGDPSQGPAFWQSEHLLVGLTDGLHAMGTVRNTTATLSAVTYCWRTSGKDWWQYTPWLRTKMKIDKYEKPLLAYVAEFGWLTGCRGAGFTISYQWTY